MTKVIEVLSGNPGVGKTQIFIDGVDSGKRYVYAAPTRKLATEVMDRLNEAGRAYTPIFTSPLQEVGSVIHKANVALADKASPLIIITHKCLASVSPELLKGWELYIDETLKVDEIATVRMLAKEYEKVIAPYVGDCAENGELLIDMTMLEEAWEIHAQGIEDAKNKRTRNKTLLLVLDAMLSPTKSVTATPSKDDKGRHIVSIRAEGFIDFTKPFTYAESVTLMGANVDNGLAAKHAERKGFTLNLDKKRSNRLSTPVILPLIRDSVGAYVSKRMLLTMPDGSVSKEWTKDCVGQHALDRALRFINGSPAIFASHEWCTANLPSNVERTPFDTRGLNQWRDKLCSIHLIHGNPSPDEYGPAKRIVERMGIPLQEGRDAMRWAREDDQLVQFAHRTKVREDSCNETTYHVVTSYTQARKLALAFDGACIIDTRLMVEPIKAKQSDKQADREANTNALANQALALQLSGLTQRKVAEKLGINQSKVKRLLSKLQST